MDTYPAGFPERALVGPSSDRSGCLDQAYMQAWEDPKWKYIRAMDNRLAGYLPATGMSYGSPPASDASAQ